jgi:hypothetical protein
MRVSRMGPGEWVGTYIAKAEGLIELLEIHACGYLWGIWHRRRSLRGLLYLEQRFEALKRKYALKSTTMTKKKERG